MKQHFLVLSLFILIPMNASIEGSEQGLDVLGDRSSDEEVKERRARRAQRRQEEEGDRDIERGGRPSAEEVKERRARRAQKRQEEGDRDIKRGSRPSDEEVKERRARHERRKEEGGRPGQEELFRDEPEIIGDSAHLEQQKLQNFGGDHVGKLKESVEARKERFEKRHKQIEETGSAFEDRYETQSDIEKDFEKKMDQFEVHQEERKKKLEARRNDLERRQPGDQHQSLGDEAIGKSKLVDRESSAVHLNHPRVIEAQERLAKGRVRRNERALSKIDKRIARISKHAEKQGFDDEKMQRIQAELQDVLNDEGAEGEEEERTEARLERLRKVEFEVMGHTDPHGHRDIRGDFRDQMKSMHGDL